MDNENERRNIAMHVRQLRRHLLPILDWMERELGPPAPEMGMAYAIEAALGVQADEDAEPLNDRHYWVLSQLAQDVKLTKRSVMEHFRYSERHTKRILSSLTKRGLIEYCSLPRPGFYRLCNPELLNEVALDLISKPHGDDAERPTHRPPVITGEPVLHGIATTDHSSTTVPST